jgi:hypothetical protein
MIKSNINSNDTRVIGFYNSMQGKPKDANGHFIGSVQNNTGLLYVINANNPSVHVWFPVDLEEYSNASAGTSGDRLGGVRIGGFKSVEAAADFVVKIFSSPDELAKFINASAQDNIGASYGLKRRQRKSALQIPVAIVPVNPADRLVRTINLNAEYGAGTIQRLMSQYPKTCKNDYNVLTVGEFEARYNLTAVAQAA